MISAMIKIPLSALVAAAIGGGVCALAGASIHPRELTVALLVAVIAAELGAAAMFFTRQASQAAVAQAGLVATMIHLFGCVIAMAVIFLGKIPMHAAFTYWFFGMYLATLIALVMGVVRQVKDAPTSATVKH